jgi:protein TonB
VIEPPPPPPPTAPEPPPPPPEPRPRVAMRRLAPKVAVETPRPPPAEPPAEPPKEPTPPVFGVTIDSTVTGESSMAVPVGDTVATNERALRKGPPAPAPSEGPPAFAPVSDSFIAQLPQVLQHDPREEEGRRGGPGVYPPEAKRLGIEGKVLVRIGIDRTGTIRWVRPVTKAGYGFEEAAVKALWHYKFSPARANDGRPVDYQITYTYNFRLGDN